MHLDIVVQAHAAAFLGRSAWDIRGDARLLADAHRTSWGCYRQRTLMPGNDGLTLELEAWGAEVHPSPAGDTWATTKPLLSSLTEVHDLPEIGRADATAFAPVLQAADELRQSTSAAVTIPVTGPLALANHLVGREVLVRELHDDPFGTRERLLALVRKLRPWLATLARRGVKITVADHYFSTDDVEPEIFAGLVVPSMAWLINEASALGADRPMLSVAGDISSVAYKLFSTNAGTVVCPAGTRRGRFFPQAREFPHTTVRLDLPPSLWTGHDWPAICQEIAAARTAARHHPNTILGTGPLPANASSVLVVDASHFTASLDEWVEP
ncbi:MAG: hypothetical protein IAE82_11855 [Opitutaceae bacterium]|nr:hypothetical protein [Opitutaceae bacterium]